MAQTLFLRLPFQPVAGSTSADYEITTDYDSARRLTVRVNASNADRLKLQPAFPGKLTFKPLEDIPIPADPSAPGTPALIGNLFLELSGTAQKELAAAAPDFNYGIVFAYLGIALDSTFFNQTVVDPLRQGTGFKLIKEDQTPLTTAAQISNAFARGALSVNITPNKTSINCAFPSASAAPNLFTFAVGVRLQWNPYEKPPELASLSSAEILADEALSPIPLVYLYRMLAHLPGWSTLAADDHSTHAFLSTLLATESPAGSLPPMRWRRLRIFVPGERPATPVARTALEGPTVRALPGAGTTPLWTASLPLLGELFVHRPDAEDFKLEVRVSATEVIKLRRDVNGADEDQLQLSWAPPAANTEPAHLDVTAMVSLKGDPLALPFLPIPQGARDEGGLTIMTVGSVTRVIAKRELVRPLQELLRTMGFRMTPTPASGVFDRRLAWALREFQIYAAMTTIAVESATATHYADRLVATPNPEPYPGDVNGIFNEATATALRLWRQNSFRCPVVAESWTINAARERVNLINDNLWSPADDPVGTHRTYVRDLTGHYTIPADHLDDGRVLLGRYQLYTTHQGVVSTPASHTSWTPDTDITPLLLVGRALAADPQPADQPAVSTYKILSAVSVAEAEHVFDSLNGYDRAVMSMGIFHWTVFLGADEAELPAYLALLRTANAVEYERCFGRFGLLPSETWPALDDPAQPNTMYQNGQKKWTARAQQRGLRDADAGAIDEEWRSLSHIDDANYLRTWHWFYRWVMANRTSTVVQRQQWHLGRLRLRAILEAPWGADPGFPTNTPQAATIGAVYSSERMVTALLRAHVHAPGTVISAGHVSRRLREAYANAGLTNHDPNSWTQANMNALQTALEARLMAYNDQLTTTIPIAAGRVDPTLGALSTARNSFQLDAAGLP